MAVVLYRRNDGQSLACRARIIVPRGHAFHQQLGILLVFGSHNKIGCGSRRCHQRQRIGGARDLGEDGRHRMTRRVAEGRLGLVVVGLLVGVSIIVLCDGARRPDVSETHFR
jgi:hypothetical protein